MALVDIETAVTEPERLLRESAHKFAGEVLRPVGRELDRLADPADVIRRGSPLWGAFERYREDLVIDMHRRVLAEIEPLRQQHGWEVIVTSLDSLHSDYVRPALGVDSRRIVALMKEFPFTLQVEDPAHFWNTSPDRYLRFAAT